MVKDVGGIVIAFELVFQLGTTVGQLFKLLKLGLNRLLFKMCLLFLVKDFLGGPSPFGAHLQQICAISFGDYEIEENKLVIMIIRIDKINTYG